MNFFQPNDQYMLIFIVLILKSRWNTNSPSKNLFYF